MRGGGVGDIAGAEEVPGLPDLLISKICESRWGIRLACPVSMTVEDVGADYGFGLD